MHGLCERLVAWTVACGSIEILRLSPRVPGRHKCRASESQWCVGESGNSSAMVEASLDGVPMNRLYRSRIDPACHVVAKSTKFRHRSAAVSILCLIQKLTRTVAMRHEWRMLDWLPFSAKLTFQACTSWPSSLGSGPTCPGAWPSPCPATCATLFDDEQSTFHLRFHTDLSCYFGGTAAATMNPDWKPTSHKR